MILVLTTEAGDYSHPNFIQWLNYYKADYLILSGESIIKGDSKVKYNSEGLFVNNINLTKSVNVIFNRRWLTSSELSNLVPDEKLNKDFKNVIVKELYEFKDFFFHELSDALWIPNLENFYVNKLANLSIAKQASLSVPEFIVTNDKNKLLNFVKIHPYIITKAIGNFEVSYTEDSYAINSIYTKIVGESLIAKLPDTFHISIFQQYIKKKKEYRVLFFNNKCYPVELLSQENSFSLIDSRKSLNETSDKENFDREVRIVKGYLPVDLETKIGDFMNIINLNIGCIDLIEDENGEFYFLEVNPVGQISGYSHRANLNFKKEIVEFMIKTDREKNERKRNPIKYQ
ncbi:hypothetical protein [Elizabethkingia meningoseptica]|uniref:ATP-grasp domain-containing protein n=2 Tax=Weeksellaceae TaxID=2762318 RepID=A0A1T3FH75_ELIME|nr:hypothetical protein [Elizabethkingia meningoseptica]AQX12496.1 hypothetical protein BBD35_08990 [Elizabethkingia meningoseptica]MBG0514039.1 hypothetical protein [Elizabethkingia meningoseptica]MDE5432954.1 hypothetical protein [Elizabethkingia meningoseptica]OOH93686.1 hypothetical protein BMF97_14750 [Elizabethkingia meningoseptica]OPB77274.1 hypothetical protein BAY31_04445 [Elizabethkingia meningoseptica]